MKKLIVASNNAGKIKEIKEILKDRYEVVPMSEAGFCEEIEENGSTFFENAVIKAKAVSSFRISPIVQIRWVYYRKFFLPL